MRKAKKPRYSEIADQLMSGIVHGRYPLGSSLPSESELCARHDVSRHTVREAIRQLEVHGLVSRHQGRGTYVQRDRMVAPTGLLMSTVDEVGRYGRLTHLVDVVMDDVVVDDRLAQVLSCDVGDRFLHIRGFRVPRRQSENVARAWSQAWVPERFADVRTEVESWQGAIYTLIEERYGKRIENIRQEAEAVNLPAPVARGLRVKTGTAALCVKRTYINRQAKPILVGLNTYVGSEFTLVMELQKARINGR
jgi:DNA-binding GntR family transcriptional regulator